MRIMMSMVTKKHILYGVFAALLLAQALGVMAADAPPRPNIVLIVADDLGYNDLGCLDVVPVKTPRLDKLASEGVRATSFYVTWPACTPSRGSILTGRYPQHNGLYEMIRNDMVNYGHRYTEEEYAISPEMTLGLDVREVVIAQVLKQAGMATGIVGKWDSGRARRFLPLQRGFDFFYGFANTGIDYFTHERYGVPSMFRGNARTQEDRGTYATDVFQREAVKFIDDHQREPFFLYLPFNAPHSASAFDETSNKPGATVGVEAADEDLKQYPGRDPKKTRYLAAITGLDRAVGAVLDKLKECDLEKNTLVIFMSDNGGSGKAANKPLRGGKTMLYEGGVRVLFMARWPGRLPAGRTTDEFLTTLELFPTLTAVAGGRQPEGIKLDGFDMTGVLRGEEKSPRKEMFWEQHGNGAARVGDWKWVGDGKTEELYDLAKDLGETKNLVAEKPEIAKMMRERYAAWKKEMDTSEPRGPFRDY